MRDSLESIEEFCIALKAHAICKAKLYDGVERDLSIDRRLVLAVEELGEIASAVTRERMQLAKYECMDLAHCAMLIAFSIDRAPDGEE